MRCRSVAWNDGAKGADGEARWMRRARRCGRGLKRCLGTLKSFHNQNDTGFAFFASDSQL